MVRNLARQLAREGLQAHVATTDDNGPETLRVPWCCPVVEDGVTYWYFPRQTRFYTVSRPLGAWLSKHVSEFDLLHIHALFSYATLPAAYWAHRNHVPYIVRPLGTLNAWGMAHRRPWLKKLSFSLLESRVLRHAALVHYTSDQERLEAESLNVSSAAAVIPNAISEPTIAPFLGRFRARYPELAGRRIVLFLARLDQIKGLDLLIDAFARVCREVADTRLVIAGEGSSEFVGRLKARATDRGIADKVMWPGFLEGDDKNAALADADVFVLPSYSENFGIAVAEAMAAGLPVVVSNHVGLHADVVAARAGLVVSCDEAQLAGALVRLLEDAMLRQSLGENGRALARRKYSPDAVARKLVSVYNDIVH